ncbi:MAG: hypothetical protein IPN47_04270 [Gemmatimonadetes bacterium]|nr:hypothetical protein [Gemmatimonadota bacterium]
MGAFSLESSSRPGDVVASASGFPLAGGTARDSRRNLPAPKRHVVEVIGQRALVAIGVAASLWIFVAPPSRA